MAKAPETPNLGGAPFDLSRTRAAADRLCAAVAAKKRIAAVSVDALSTMIHRVSTGCCTVDVAFGGGLPRGRIVGLYGDPSKGKSTLAAIMAASAQRHCRYCHQRIVKGECSCPPLLICGTCRQPAVETVCACTAGTPPVPVAPKTLLPPCRNCLAPVVGYDPDNPAKVEAWKCACEVAPPDPVTERAVPMVILWWDVERAYTTGDDAKGSQQERMGWLESLGVDPRGVILTQVTAETGIDMVKVAIQERLADIIVVDSIAQLVPAAEWENLYGEKGAGQGAVPRLVNQAFRKWGGAFSDLGLFETRPPTLITINQVRLDLKVSFGSPEVLPGGKGQLFANSILARVGGKVFRHGERSTRGWGSYRVLEIDVEKNKTGLEGGHASVAIRLDEVSNRLDDPRATVSEAKLLDLVEKVKGGWAIKLGGKESVGPFSTQKEAGDALAADPRLYDRVRRHVVAVKLSLVTA